MTSSKVFSVFVLLPFILPFVSPNPQASKNRFKPEQTYCGASTPCVLTYHNDGSRGGVNPNESVLKATTLNSSNHPVPQWLATVDGPIYAQPLYVHQLLVNDVAKNVVLVATQNNSVYSLDSDSTSSTGTVLAQVSLNNAGDLGTGYTEIAVPYTDLLQACNTILPEVGITSTPAVDVSVTPPVLYVVTKHEDVDSSGGKTYRQKLHGLYADTLQEIPGSPVVLDTTFAKNYAPGFNPLSNGQRPGLALVVEANGISKVWVAWGSHCDVLPYSGMAIEFTYNYNTPGFANTYTVFNAESACSKQPCQSGIWMGGGAPAVDAQGSVYLSTGNGADKLQGAGEYSNSVVRLNDAGFQDFYSPPDYDALNKGKHYVACTNPNPPSCPSPCQWDSTHQYCQWDLIKDDFDVASGGVVLLNPTFALANPQIIGGGKEGMMYSIFAQNMGHIDAHNGDADEWACTPGTAPAPGTIAQCFLGFTLPVTQDSAAGSWGTPAFFSGGVKTGHANYLYVAGSGNVLRAYTLRNEKGVGIFASKPAEPKPAHKYHYPGASPSITWNRGAEDTADAIVWTLENGSYGKLGVTAGAAVLYAYKAVPDDSSLGAELWDTSAYDKTIPGSPGAVKFVVPTIVDGKIFLAGGAQGYQPGSSNCPVPSVTVQPTACGGIAMFK